MLLSKALSYDIQKFPSIGSENLFITFREKFNVLMYTKSSQMIRLQWYSVVCTMYIREYHRY